MIFKINLTISFISAVNPIIITNFISTLYSITEVKIDIKLQAQTFWQERKNFSGPVVGVSLLDFYRDIEVNQFYVAYYMRTNINHYGTETSDFFSFLRRRINYNYELMNVIQYFGSNLPSVLFLITQVVSDLQAKILPIIKINGILPGQGSVIDQYTIINGIYGDLNRPYDINFEFLNTVPGIPKQGSFKGRQIHLLWSIAPGCYFGSSQHSISNY